MGTYAAPAGLGMTGAGIGLNAYGQDQAARAMNRAWGAQTSAQRGYDAALDARTQQLIQNLTPETLVAPQVAAETRQKLDTTSKNTASAVAKAGSRKGGGAESKARNAQAMQDTLVRALQDNRVQAALRALTSGQQRVNLLGREYGVDAGMIRGDANQWAKLVPMQQQAAGMEGGWARSVGNAFNQFGQLGMAYGMSQPKAQAAAPAPIPGQSPEDYILAGTGLSPYDYGGR